MQEQMSYFTLFVALDCRKSSSADLELANFKAQAQWMPTAAASHRVAHGNR
jgi:hypothetical protein